MGIYGHLLHCCGPLRASTNWMAWPRGFGTYLPCAPFPSSPSHLPPPPPALRTGEPTPSPHLILYPIYPANQRLGENNIHRSLHIAVTPYMARSSGCKAEPSLCNLALNSKGEATSGCFHRLLLQVYYCKRLQYILQALSYSQAVPVLPGLATFIKKAYIASAMV